LSAGAATTVFIDASATAQGVLSNVSSVGSGVADSIPADNAITLTNTALPLADLAVTVLDAPDPVLLGSNLVYTLTVTNRGPSTALNVRCRMFFRSGRIFFPSPPARVLTPLLATS
jgi:hypothetical protein